MKPYAIFLRECDNDDLYEFAPESGLGPAETDQMRQADALNDEIRGSVGGDTWNVLWLQRGSKIDTQA